MAASYNNSVWFYDRLSRVVFGKALIKAQQYLLRSISPGSNILIAGGGTGWILEEITKLQPSGLRITYVEVASKMMALSKKRNIGDNNVIFINDAVENVALQPGFDVVMTPFLFDNFTEETLRNVFGHIHPLLKPGGVWLNTDFQIGGKLWQKILLNAMFVLFRLVGSVEASKLPDIDRQFEQHGYGIVDQQTFFGDFVTSRIYKMGQGPR